MIEYRIKLAFHGFFIAISPQIRKLFQILIQLYLHIINYVGQLAYCILSSGWEDELFKCDLQWKCVHIAQED